MKLPIPNRRGAGRTLANFLGHYRNRTDLLVLALSESAVPVAYEIARYLEAPLDLLLLRELTPPQNEALGAAVIASEDVDPVEDPDLRSWRDSARWRDWLRTEQHQLRQAESRLRGDRPRPKARGKTLILVEDSLDSGDRMRMAIRWARQQGASRLVAATPVAPTRILDGLGAMVDETVFMVTQEPFLGPEWWYEDFRPVSPEESRALLERARRAALSERLDQLV